MRTNKNFLLLLTLILIFAGAVYFRAEAFMPPALDEDHIIINKTNNKLYYYENRKLQKVYNVSTGKIPELTPEGWFRIVTMHKNPHGGEKVNNNPFGSRWMGLGIPGHEDGLKYGIHGTDSPETIGTYESGGCIRMDNNDAKELYSLVQINTPVIIFSDITLTGFKETLTNP